MGKPHALVLPFPAQGHINPMLNFAKQLASRGVIITFLNTEKTQRRMAETANGQDSITLGFDFRFAAIPDGSDQPLIGTSGDGFQLSNVWAMLKGLESQQGAIEEMVMSSRASPDPITCIIADSFFPWASILASKLGIQRVIFWTSNGNSLAIAMQLKIGKLSFTDGVASIPVVDNASVTGSRVVASFRLDPERAEKLVERLSHLEHVTCIIVNTLKELEGSTLEAMTSCSTKVQYVGPIMPPLHYDTRHFNVSFYKEEECIQWLDKQPPRSVLYISFGSIATLSPQELQELAFGVEESKQTFLWVWRDHHELFPDGFLDRTRDRGLVVKWSPQLEVLGHLAIGAFLTHCGWNSVLESIHMGVPMLCYPRILDQHLNALLITNDWKLGIPLFQEKDKLTREEVQSGIKTIFDSSELQKNSLMWKNMARHALEGGGSSYHALEEFLEQLSNECLRISHENPNH